MPITDCMIFLKGQNPIYAKKAIPFDIPECGYKASGEWKTCYQEACGKGSEDTWEIPDDGEEGFMDIPEYIDDEVPFR